MTKTLPSLAMWRIDGTQTSLLSQVGATWMPIPVAYMAARASGM